MLTDIEPMMPSEAAIADSDLPSLAMKLEVEAGKLEGALNPITALVIESHMRVINSYYSNLIEGNSTHPKDIRRAMEGDYSADPAKRDLQLESVAHIAVQEKLAQGDGHHLMSAEFLQFVHAEFYKLLPDALRMVTSSSGREMVVEPGCFRQPGEEVVVGDHVPPSPENIGRYLERFFQAYRLDYLHGQNRVIAAMVAHHRFLWIHPFLDGNGRVGRLFTDHFLKSLGVGACGVWCLSRGLARRNAEYKSALARADYPRQGERDGRGALSEKYLISFCTFMLETAIDQVEYMSQLIDLRGMMQRIKAYIDDRNKGLIPGLSPIKPEAARLIERAFLLGEFPKSEIVDISGLGLSVTRKLVQQLKEEGLLTETSSRSPLCWAIPEHAERYYFPGLV